MKSRRLYSHILGINPTVTEMACSANNSTLLLLFIGVVTLVIIAARKMFSHDPREPPLAPQAIPMIGHMVGLSRSKFNYYVDLRYAHSPMPNHHKP